MGDIKLKKNIICKSIICIMLFFSVIIALRAIFPFKSYYNRLKIVNTQSKVNIEVISENSQIKEAFHKITKKKI